VDQDRSRELSESFQVASSLRRAEQQIYLRQVCAHDRTLKAELEELLKYHESTTDARFDNPAALNVTDHLMDHEMRGGSDIQDPLIGSRIGSYDIQRLIGWGGFGNVYLATRACDFDQKVAIKILRTEEGFNEIILRRFQVERQVLADLDHEGIARLIDGGSDDRGRPYLVMEYVSGETILDYCDRNRLGTQERLEIFRKVCAAVAHAHAFGVVHRDIKPANILVSSNGAAKLVDFGIAKLTDLRSRKEMLTLTRAGLLPLTPDYASPEQIRGENVGLASDVYSLGIVLYELLTGRRPYVLDDMSPQDMERTICTQLPPRPSSTVLVKGSRADGETTAETICQKRSADPRQLRRSLRDLDNIVLMALRKEPGRRYRSAAELEEDVRRHLQGLPVAAGADSLSYRTRKFLQRHTRSVVAATLILLSLIGGLVTSWFAWQREARLADKLQEHLYVSNVQLAFESLQRKDFQDVQQILRRHVAGQDAAAPLGIEWYLLDGLSRPPTPMVLARHVGPAYEIAVVPEKPWVVSVGQDDSIFIWNSDTGRQVACLQGDGPYRSVAVSPDGRYLAAGQQQVDDRLARVALWDLPAMKFVGLIAECPATPESLAFSPDSQVLAIGPRYDEIILVSVPDGTTIAHRAMAPSASPGARNWNLAFMDDGSLLVPARNYPLSGATEHVLQLWNGDLKERIGEFERTDLNCFAISRDRRLLAASSDWQGILTVFDGGSRELMLEKDISVGPKCVAISPDSQHVAVGFDGGTICHLQLHIGVDTDATRSVHTVELAHEFRFDAHANRVRSIAFTEKGQLVSCGDDGLVKVWPKSSTAALDRIGPPVHVEAHDFPASRGGRFLLCGRDRTAWVSDSRDPSRWQRIATIDLAPPYTAYVLSGGGDRMVVGNSSGKLAVVDADPPYQTRQMLKHGEKGILGGAFSPDDRLVAVTGNDKWTTVWEVDSGKLKQKFFHADDGTDVAFSPDGRRIACGGPFREIQVYDVASGQMKHAMQTKTNVTSMAWSTNGQFLASGHLNGDVVLHELTDSKSRSTLLNGHGDSVNAVMFSADGRTLFTAGHDTMVRLWHVSTRRALGALLQGQHPSARVLGLAQSPDGRRIFAAIANQGMGRSIQVFNASAPGL
jgi:serine/threonine protein kinase/WD40 repeat protein